MSRRYPTRYVWSARGMVDGVGRVLRERRWPHRLRWTAIYTTFAEWRCHRLGFTTHFGARRPDQIGVDYADLWFLYRLVRRRRPSTILELGSGFSTAAFAAALAANDRGHLYSVDPHAEWLAHAACLVPPAVRDRVTFIHGPVTDEARRGYQGCVHANLPTGGLDFLYVDSPPLESYAGRPLWAQVSFDALDLEPHFNPGCVMVVDGRTKTVAMLRALLRRRYVVTERPRFKNTVFQLVE
jgi:SAM-dependent methyltransferase